MLQLELSVLFIDVDFLNDFPFFRFLNSEEFFDCFLDSLIDLLLSFNFNLGVSVDHLDSSFTVLAQALPLSTLPLLSESLNCLQHKSALVVTDLAVLAHCVEANDEIVLNNVEIRAFNLLKFLDFHFISLTSGNSIFLFCLLLLLMGFQLFPVLLVLGGYTLVVLDCSVESRVAETRVVDERH